MDEKNFMEKRKEYIDELKKYVSEENMVEVLKICQKLMNTSYIAGQVDLKNKLKEDFDKIWRIH